MTRRSLAIVLVLSLLIGMMMPIEALAATQKFTKATLSGSSVRIGSTVKLTYVLKVKADVTIRVLNAEGLLAAEYQFSGVSAKKTKSFSWKCAATANNALGLALGEYVPVGAYVVEIESLTAKKTLKLQVKPKLYKVKSVALDAKKLTLFVGDTAQLTETISPENATNKDVKWSTSNKKYATVSKGGLITAKAKGTAKISVTTVDGSKKATVTVTVVKRPPAPPVNNPGEVPVPSDPPVSGEPGTTPTPTPTPTPKPTPTPTPTPKPTPTPTPTPTPKPTPTPTPTPKPTGIAHGNLSGNSAEYGWGVTLNNKVYYIDQSASNKGIYEIDSADKITLLRAGTFEALNALDGFLYFVDYDAGGYWRMKLDGTNATRIITGDLAYVQLLGGKLYFKDYDQNGHLHSANLDGSGRQPVISSTQVGNINVSDTKLYFWAFGAGARDDEIFTANLDGTGMERVGTVSGAFTVGADGYIYYGDSADNYALYRMKTDGTGVEKLTNTKVSARPIYHDGYVYYQSDNSINRMNVSTKSAERLSITFDSIYHYAIAGRFLVVSDRTDIRLIDLSAMKELKTPYNLKGKGRVISMGATTETLFGGAGNFVSVVECLESGKMNVTITVFSNTFTVTIDGVAGKQYRILTPYLGEMGSTVRFDGSASTSLDGTSARVTFAYMKVSYSEPTWSVIE